MHSQHTQRISEVWDLGHGTYAVYRSEDSRNGMIWLYDMQAGTCTNAIACHSQQVRRGGGPSQ